MIIPVLYYLHQCLADGLLLALELCDLDKMIIWIH
jgi:hypothetical protein